MLETGEFHRRNALRQFVRKGGMSFSRISHTRCLSGSVMCCEKKNLKITFQCRRKNVIMVVYGKSDCGHCPDICVRSRCLPKIISAYLRTILIAVSNWFPNDQIFFFRI